MAISREAAARAIQKIRRRVPDAQTVDDILSDMAEIAEQDGNQSFVDSIKLLTDENWLFK